MMRKWAAVIYEWAAMKARTKGAVGWLALFFFLEIVLFIPLDAVLVVFCLENPSRRWVYVTVVTLVSLLSGLTGYIVGAFAWEMISPYVLGTLLSPAIFNRVCAHYQDHQQIAVFLGSLLPLPFKAVTLSAGVCHLSLWPFLSMVLGGRAVRFFVASQAALKWGVKLKEIAGRHWRKLAFFLGAKIALGFTFFWALG